MRERIIIAVISAMSGVFLGGAAIHIAIASRLSAVEVQVRELQTDVRELRASVMKLYVPDPKVRSMDGGIL
jgi:hypothetical protein